MSNDDSKDVKQEAGQPSVSNRWLAGDPPQSGYYLATWRMGCQFRVSELWFNPDGLPKWWNTRGYMPGNDTRSHADCKVNTVLAWMSLPQPPNAEVSHE